MSGVEAALRALFERGADPLTAKQLAQRIGCRSETAHFKCAELVAEGYLKRRYAVTWRQAWEYQRADAPWPDNTLATQASEQKRLAKRAAKQA